MDRVTHMSDADLILFSDQEMHTGSAEKIETHLKICAECRKRLNDLQSGAAAYDQYHQQILKPALGSTASDWGTIRDRLAKEHSGKGSFWFNPAILWAGAALAGGLIVAILYFQSSSRPQATELLARAAAIPESSRGPLLLTVGGHHWLRPAVFRAGESAISCSRRRKLELSTRARTLR